MRWRYMQPSKRVKDISLSGIRKMFELVGEDSINLGLGEPDFDTPEYIREAAKKALEGTDIEEIKKTSEELNKVAMDLAAKVYEQAAKDNANNTETNSGNDNDHEKVEDATYEEK